MGAIEVCDDIDAKLSFQAPAYEQLLNRGDPPHAPLREFVAMRLAKRCGVHAAEVEFASVGDREVLLVRRFDRHVDAQGQVFRRL